jgi:CRP-like cAMP-binding protein
VYGHGSDGAAEIPLTQEEVAGLAGTTRGTVNAVLRDAQASGYIELARGRIRVLDPDGLMRKAR